MKQVYALISAFLIAAVLTFMSAYFEPKAFSGDFNSAFDIENAIIPQKVLNTTQTEQNNTVIYYKDSIIGVLNDDSKLDQMLAEVYQNRYAQDFPDTKLGLGEDVHIVNEINFFTYENKDDEILKYINENNLFSVEANKIEFSNGEVIYVKNIDDFVAARDDFALNFIDKKSFKLINSGSEVPLLGDHEYSTRVENAYFKEEMSVSKGLAPINKIAKTKEEALKIISYGYDSKAKFYTTKEYDTIQGIAWLNHIPTSHLLALNQDSLVNENQLVKVGMKLNVTAINSPIHYEVIKENQVEETVYPESTLIVYDDTLREGMEIIDTKQELGKENARYQETFVNGQSTGNGKKISSIITKQPVREVKRVGTKVYPHIGSGHFRWPVEVASITCGWYCYSGHTATDVQNRYNFYGKVLASDRGTIVQSDYHPVGGYRVIIDHNNGYQTYYGHMSGPGFFPVGTVVQQGEAIGNIGMTGVATGPHVHFEVRYHGVQIDPQTVVGR